MINSSNKIRIKDIAKLANISPGTIDRVLHNRGEVKEETRDKIMKIIDELGYTPNLLAKSLALKKLYRICVLIPSSDKVNPYWNKPLAGLTRALEEIKDFNTKVEIYNYEIDSEANFEQILSDIIASEPDGIIFTPHFVEISHKKVELCNSKNIPVVFLDSNIESENALGYFGQNAYSSGYLAARLMSYGLNQNSTVLVLKLAKNRATFPHLMKREEGFLSFFSENPQFGIKTHSVEIDLLIEGEPTITLSELLKNTKGLEGIFVTNSRVHKVARILKEQSLSHLLLIGYDLVDESIHFLEDGIIDFLICQKPEDQGYRSVMALFNHILLKKSIERVNYSPIDIIMKDNYVSYIKNLNN